jgi:hypothetical protein
MDRVVALLKEKNQYLEQFHMVNEHELINFSEGNFDSVEAFYQTRDKLLDLIKTVDEAIEEENRRINVGPVTNAARVEVASLLNQKDELVKSIVGQDLELLSYIEREKSNIIRELHSNSTAKKAVGAYASTERLQVVDGE